MLNYLETNYIFNLIYHQKGDVVLKLDDKNSEKWALNFWNFSITNHNLNSNQLIYYNNPIYKKYAFSYKIDKVIIDDYNHYPKIYLNAKYNYKEYIFDSRTKTFYYNDFLPTDLIINVNINGKYQETFVIDKISKFKESETIILEPEIDCYENDISINIECNSSYGYFYNKSIYLPTKIKTDYDLKFTSNYLLNLFIPIYYQENEIYYDKFYFLKLFRNKFYYPKNIKALILLLYDDPDNWEISFADKELSGNIYLPGIADNSHQFEINFYSYKNIFLFYVDDIYYYDYKNKESINGINQDFNSVNGISLPWDYSNNEGYINFNLSLLLFQDAKINLNFYLPIEIKNSLRGEQNSKLKLIEVFDYSDFNDPNIIWEKYA
ncbi:/ / hypothetical protein / 70917:72053 Forward [Candidatus Hepatoplasma crinochetorum]|uniref:Uncharacterized protein n=1 Tax=Candidatus Hepatoplasma crinochetorum TaxID=295596 RepID=A0A0G7ZNA9_9MOLU|nr:/ / hypothetical protein / 70917:72053 Forward [Candidatus Hepatoplasma crinochetorum]